MAPLYVLCPHCEFPAVVRGFDREVPRYCRQCRKVFVPGETLHARGRSRRANGEGVGSGKHRRALALRSLVRHGRRKVG